MNKIGSNYSACNECGHHYSNRYASCPHCTTNVIVEEYLEGDLSGDLDDILPEGCPNCGSYEGDYNECPECGHGQ
jgi:hypothetical protein